MKGNGHHQFCTIYGSNSCIKHGTQKIQYMMNLNAANVFSIYHPLFYVSNMFIESRFSQRCFQTVFDVKLPLLLSVSVFITTSCCFYKDWNAKSVPLLLKTFVDANSKWAKLSPQLLLYFCRRSGSPASTWTIL